MSQTENTEERTECEQLDKIAEEEIRLIEIRAVSDDQWQASAN